jgi:cytosine/adenosine deaminase-related metal-dependent hydrolase
VKGSKVKADMAYKKFQADQLFTGYALLDNHVLITDENGKIADIVIRSEAGDDIKKFEGILSPGFVNCHCHLELSHLKGLIPKKTGLVDFVYKVVTERHHAEEEILAAIITVENEMLENGIIAVGDICNNLLTLSQKQKSNLRYYNFIEASGWLPEVSQMRFERARGLYEAFSNKNSAFRSSIVPHAPYSVSENLWNQIQPFFENKVVTIHNQETKFEDEFFLEGTGDFTRMYQLMKIDNSHHQPTKRSSLQSYFNKLQKAKNILLVHNTFINQADIDFINTASCGKNTFFCLCINANLYIEDCLPPVEMLRKNNCRIVLGTDSLASNRSLSITDEINTIRENFPATPLVEVLQWATINGAKALEIENDSGSFEKGKTPGIIQLVLSDKKIEKIKRLT